MRSPMTSCSVMTAKSGPSNPCSSPSTASPIALACSALASPKLSTRLIAASAVVGEHAAHAVGGALAPAGNDDALAGLLQRSDVRGRSLEDVRPAAAFLCALGREVASGPPAGIGGFHRSGALNGDSRR